MTEHDSCAASPSALPAADLRGLSLVLLGPLDTPKDWQEIDSLLTLAPAEIPAGGWAHLRTDGYKMWIEMGK